MEYLAEATNKTPERIRNLIDIVQGARTSSLDAAVIEDGTPLLDMVADPRSTVDVDVDHDRAMAALALLPDDVREIVERSVFQEDSLRAIGADHGLTGEAIRHKKSRGLNSLRHILCTQPLAA